MGNICEIFSKNSKYEDDDDFIYYNKKNKEEIIPPEIEYDQPPSYNSINHNQSTPIPIVYDQKTHPIPIVYDQKKQFIEYRTPTYIENSENYQDFLITGVFAGVVAEDMFNCD
tara:strand:+ start:436 stop:774 length:339 start_codon:yes stop_codon:yes gene_type:complete